jgi:hypothetical protein
MVKLELRNRERLARLDVPIPVREDSDVQVRFVELAQAAGGRANAHRFKKLHGNGSDLCSIADVDCNCTVLREIIAGTADERLHVYRFDLVEADEDPRQRRLRHIRISVSKHLSSILVRSGHIPEDTIRQRLAHRLAIQ